MKGPVYKFASLDDQGLEKLKAMEEAYGAVVLAVEPRPSFAHLSEEQVRRLQALEQELGAILIAYQE